MGRETPFGYAYHGSFNSDSLRNMAVIAELSKGIIPPPNPYFSGETFHYYWLFYLAPAIIYKILGKGVSLQDLMTWHVLFAGLLFMTVVFCTLRLYTRRVFLLGFGMFLLLLATNYKGFYLWWTFPGNTWDFFNQIPDLKIESSLLKTWYVPIMGLYRYLLLAPQHLLALAFFLMGWTLYTNDECRMQNDEVIHGPSIVVSFIMGGLLGYSGFIGLIAILWYGGWLFISAFMDKKALGRNLVRFFIAMVIVSIPLLGFYALDMVVLGRENLIIYLNRVFLKNAIPILFMNLGPGFVLGTLGMITSLWIRRNLMLPNFWLVALCSALFTTVIIQNDWEVTTKASLIILINLTFFSTLFLDAFWDWAQRKKEVRSQGSGARSARVGSWILVPGFWLLLLTLLCLSAIPTAVLDAYVYGWSISPADTKFVNAEDMRALTWIRDNLSEESIIQDMPAGYREDDRDIFYSKIPSFAHRRVTLGVKLHTENFQIPEKWIASRIEKITQLFETHDLTDTVSITKQLGIQYIYVGPTERKHYPIGLNKFDNFKDLFRPVYKQGRVSIFQVLGGEPELVTLRPYSLGKGVYQTQEVLSLPLILQNQNHNYPVRVELALQIRRAGQLENEEVNQKEEEESVSGSLPYSSGSIELNPGEEKTLTLTTQTPKDPGTYQVEVVGKVVLKEEAGMEKVFLQSEDLPYQVGQDIPDSNDSTGISRVGLHGKHKRGFLTYGPYIKLPPGEYVALFRLKGKDLESGKNIATLDVAADKGRKVLAERELFSEDFTESGLFQDFKVPFALNKAHHVEFRTYFHGEPGRLFIDSITMLAPRSLDHKDLALYKKLDSVIVVQ
jgi:hypothetical protein